ncbi:MAG: hypothetical protein WC055_00760 [Melioribacteraceae bacterium]
MIVFPERLKDLDVLVSGDFRLCMKRPIPVKAAQVNKEFRVKTLEGDYKLGKSGDYLMCGVDDELYICDREIFEKNL